MKLYDFPSAPNPKRVKIFANEKGIELELVPCDMRRGEHKSPAFLKKNPSGKIPVLELENGRCISESVAICRYLEAICPEPNLFGEDAFELGHIEARNRHIEFEMWREIGISWVHGPIVAQLGIVKQIPEVKTASDMAACNYYERLDLEFAESAYVAGDRFTIADISLFTAIEFGSAMVDLKPDARLKNLHAWYESVRSRPSVSTLE
ncbi:MAG: glutathione S-transferase [Oceanospirillaceae bacterium]|jgi:glutathione S-transferase